MGVVYLATDLKLGRKVALKMLHHAIEQQQLVLEAQNLAKLDHPNIGTVYSLEETPEGQPFLVMAYYQGQTLEDLLQGGALPQAQTQALLAQALQGLQSAHQHGLLHRDLKPANLMVLPSDRLKILDFGLAQLLHQAAHPAGSLSGTLPYMAPELLQGQPASTASDVWALGVVLYQMLLGQHPFGQQAVGQTLLAILNNTPNLGSLDGPWVQLLQGMLHKNPQQRLSLEAALLQLPQNTTAPAPVSQAAVTVQAPVGREREWRVLQSAQAAQQTVWLSGLAGMGKTHLMQSFLPGPITQLRPNDPGIPYASLSRWLRQLLKQTQLALPAWVQPELARLLPELGHSEPIRENSQKLRLYQAVLVLLQAASPACLALDNLHWADEASLEALGFVLAELQPAPFALFSYRSDELSPAAQAFLHESLRQGAVQVELGPLSLEAVQRWLEQQGHNPQDAEHYYRYTGGQPFLLQQALHSPDPNLSGSSPVQAVLKSKLLRLSPLALDLARLAAVADNAMSIDLAAAVLQQSLLSLATPWAQLEQSQILQGRVFSHDLWRQAVLEHTPHSVQQRLHQQIAEHLGAQGSPAQVAYHYRQAGLLQHAAPLECQAALLAKAQFRLREAYEMFVNAAQHLPPPKAFDALMQAQDCLLHLDFGPEHQQLVQRLLQLAQSPQQKAQAFLAQATSLEQSGDGAAVEAAAKAGLQWASSLEPAQQYPLYGALGRGLWIQGRIAEACQAFEQNLVQAKAAQDWPEIANALGNLAMCTPQLGPSLSYAAQAVDLLQNLAEPTQLRTARMNYGLKLMLAGQMQEGLHQLEQAKALLEEMGEAQNPHTYATLAHAYKQTHRYSESLEHYQKALAVAQQMQSAMEPYILGRMGGLLCEMGALSEGLAMLQQALSAQRFYQPAQKLILQREQLWYAAWQQAPNLQAWQALAQQVGSQPSPGKIKLDLLMAQHQEAEVHLKLALEALQYSQEYMGLRLAAHSCTASAYGRLGQWSQALVHSQQALELSHRYAPDDYYWGLVLLVHWQALKASDHPQTQEHRLRCQQWLRQTLQKVPSQYQSGFVLHNPTNQVLWQPT